MTFLSGVVEGFYGRQWSWELRRSYANFLQDSGLNSYLYCPKGDGFLRRQWWQPWPSDIEQQLRQLAGRYRQRGLNWGVGLSPFALYQDYSSTSRRQLRDKITAIDSLGGNLLAILFDDMPGDCPDLARRQADIVSDVRQWSAAEHLLVCPTYYSFDAQLERYFGPRPQDYWSDLGHMLPVEAMVMWTGNEVCAATISGEDILAISELVGRKPLLWDNYPVNDGAKACNFLHLEPLPGREQGLQAALCGHFCNPMNQASLSRFPLAGLAQLYGGPEAVMSDYFSPALVQHLRSDSDLFQNSGLSGISATERERLADVYSNMDDPAALEIADWLRGGYGFDPACLTD